jgi:hypothetical protein
LPNVLLNQVFKKFGFSGLGSSRKHKMCLTFLRGTNGVPSSARGDAIVRARETGFGNMQIECWLAFGLVLGFDNLAGFIRVAGALTILGVHAIILSTANATTS